MKKVKIVLPMLALIIAVAGSAFTTHQNLQKYSHTNPLWHFTGTTVGQQADQENYESASSTNLPDCIGQNLYCVIEAPEDQMNPGFPDLSDVNQIDVKSRKP